MDGLGFWCVLLAVVLVLLIVGWRAKLQLTLFVLRFHNGRIDYVKGRIPRRLLDDIADVTERDGVQSLIVTCRIEDGRAQLEFKGTSSAGLEQVLRNLVGEYPLIRLKTAPRSRRSVG